MDEEMEDNTGEFTFTAVEIELDYEFEAVRYFDFSREETAVEAREAELWFESAESYPPSPFAAKSIPREDLLENVNVSPKSKGLEMESGCDMGQAPEESAMAVSSIDCDGKKEGSLNLKNFSIQEFQNQPHSLPTGLTFYDGMRNDNFKLKTKSTSKPSFPRTSTLMKPTASQLAKQNQQRQVDDSRFRKLENNNSSGIESQAAKRQKLEGGHLHKVPDSKPQANFVHKAPKREGTIDGNSAHGRLRITIPIEPDLETAHRARRIRPKTNRELEHVPSTAPAFKALPLNRKIFEAPSLVIPKRSTPQLPEFQEFHLKTSERAMQHSTAVWSSSSCCYNKVQRKPSILSAAECSNRESKRSTPQLPEFQEFHLNTSERAMQHTTAVSSSSSCYNKEQRKPSILSAAEYSNRELKRPNLDTAPKKEGCEMTHKFKALNKKIFSSKGDMGVFRNNKRETTVPMEFNFQTEKRVQPALTIELFNKLSLTSELHQDSGSQLIQPRPTSIFLKGSKENRSCSFQQESDVSHKTVDNRKTPRVGTKHVQFASDKGIAKVGTFSRMSRSLGIR